MYKISVILCIFAGEFSACASHISQRRHQFLRRSDHEPPREDRNIKLVPDDTQPNNFWGSFRESLASGTKSARHVAEASANSAEEFPVDPSAAVSGLHNPSHTLEISRGAVDEEHKHGPGTAESKYDDWASGYHPSLDTKPAPGIPEFQSHEPSPTASADTAVKSKVEVTTTADDSSIDTDLLSRNPSNSDTTVDGSTFYLKFLDAYTKHTETAASRTIAESGEQLAKQADPAGSHATEDPDKRPAAQIPQQLVCTGSQDIFELLSDPIKSNIRKTLEMNPGFELRYFGDKACYSYLEKHFPSTQLAALYRNETHGMYRGDICRAAVLANEGGFYTDLDLEMIVPFKQIVDQSITFISAHSVDGDILNALMGVTPGNPIMKKMIVELENWYTGPRQGFLGTQAALLALHDLQGENCVGVELNDVSRPDIQCGAENVRILKEMRCEDSREGCPENRKEGLWLKYGIYTSQGDQVGWSRFSECMDFGCSKQGGTGKLLLLPELGDGTVLMQMFSTGKSTALRSLGHEASATI